MLRILFWNLNRQHLSDEVSALSIEHQVDIIILAEDTLASVQRLQALNSGNERKYFVTMTACERISIYTTFSDRFIRLRRESEYYTFREVHLPAHHPFLLCAIHWKSQMWRSVQSQSVELIEIARVIREEERHCGHQRTVMAGDFNVDPFNDGMIAANGLHAVMSRQIAAREQREIGPFGPYPFFYNPMWSCYGDESEGPPGTYFRSSAEGVCQYWHVFDQILVRSSLIPYLPERSVQIPVTAGEQSLVSSIGRPSVSDHLPVIFQFDLPLSV